MVVFCAGSWIILDINVVAAHAPYLEMHLEFAVVGVALNTSYNILSAGWVYFYF